LLGGDVKRWLNLVKFVGVHSNRLRHFESDFLFGCAR
jgi:hypothetical protein